MSERGVLTGRLIRLASLTEADLEPLHEWFVEANPERLTCRPVQERSASERLERFRQRAQSETSRTFAVHRLTDGRLVGRVSYFDLNSRNRAAEIGFLIGHPYRRQGYGIEALRLLLHHLFKDLRLNKAMAQTGVYNQAAVALLTRLGFIEDGRLRQHHVIDGKFHDDILFSLLAEEFKDALGGKHPRKEFEDHVQKEAQQYKGTEG